MIAWIWAELSRWGRTLRWSLQGLASTFAREKSFRQWALANLASAGLAFWLPLGGAGRALVIALGLLVLAAELLNSAVEETVDYISTEQDPRAGRAKDAASAAVLLTALAWGAAWVLLLLA